MPTLSTLEIEFGGLCMLVQRNTSGREGLYALMPKMDHPKMLHEAMLLVCDATYSGGTLPKPVRLRGRVLDWRGLAAPAAAVAMPPAIPNFAKFAGDAVNAAFLSGTPTACLAARVELPLGSSIAVDSRSEIGEVEVDYGGSKHTEKVVGQATVTVKVTNSSVTTLDVGNDEAGQPVTLTPDGAGRIVIKIINIIRADLRPPCKAHMPAVKKGDDVTHALAYYDLLGNRCNGHKEGPHLIALHDRGEENLFFIHPYQCTLGTG
ncbi:MAG TPA: hypothetical protein VFJ74_09245 [Gemmatimonadaceae bacterium]|nr:hypothetical protein [Gemmatimonadaceae bacterium]